MKKKLLSLLLCAATASTLFAGTAYASGDAEEFAALKNDIDDDEGMDPQYGGTVKYGVMQLLTSPGRTSLNSNASVTNQMRAAYESLLWYDNDGNLIPQLATEYEADPEEPSITWTLREGVTFADGSAFNAEAVARNIQDYQEASRAETKLVADCEIIDDLHIKTVFSEWSSSAVENIGVYVLYNSIAALDDPDQLNSSSCGTGPFVVTSFEPGIKMVMEKNENYWQEERPYLDSVEMYEFSDTTTLSSTFQAGDMNMIFIQPQNAAYDLIASCAAQFESGEYIYTEGVASMGGVAPNSKEEGSPWQNPLVRRALAYAIDKDGIKYACYEDKQPIADQFALPGSKYFDEDLVAAEYDPEKAKELLAEAGYPDGFDTTMNCLANSQNIFTAIAAGLEDVGIHCEINLVDNATIATYMAEGSWSGLIQYNVTYGDDIALYLGNAIGEEGNIYAKGILLEDEAQEALTGMRKAASEEEKLEYAKTFTELEFDAESGLYSFVPFTYNVARHFKNHAVLGDDASAAFTYYWDHANTWINQ